MSYREFHYRWEYKLKSPREKLWPLVANTDRFNRDAQVPSLDHNQPLPAGRRRLRLKVFGMPVEWEETPFEWVRPSRIGSTRTYSKGPIASIRVLIQLLPREDGGTNLIYEIWARPKSPLGLVAIPLQIGLISARRFGRTFKEYDSMVQSGESISTEESAEREISPAEAKRLALLAEKMVERGVPSRIAKMLTDFVAQADEMDLTRIRPYALADAWSEPRRTLLEACFHATRVGLLDLQWDLLCPMCRGPQESNSTLRDIHAHGHCAGCEIDFDVNFDRFVEVTFRPNASVRAVDPKTYCMGSPQRTPHVIAQQILPPRTDRMLTLPLEAGRYRVRTPSLRGEQKLEARRGGPAEAVIELSRAGWGEDLQLSTSPNFKLVNNTDAEQVFVLERTAWTDQAATAAEVTALQIFRDLFSTEALRPGEQISVGTLTVLFTDLRNSTQLYREIGDATAFGCVLNHFEVLKKAISDEDGAVVKTIGDAVMAVFRRPAGALRAMLAAQEELAIPGEGRQALTLKAGMHQGPCIAVTLNDRLDYFGSTVNMAARLECLSTGHNVIISQSVYEDPEVQDLFEEQSGLESEEFDVTLKGFAEEHFQLIRVGRKAAAALVSPVTG
jgi:adenylate cyclase